MLACTPVLMDGTRGPRIFAASSDVHPSLPAARIRHTDTHPLPPKPTLTLTLNPGTLAVNVWRVDS